MGFASDQTRRWLVLALTVTAQFMVILDVAVVVVALPEIKNDLGFSQEGVQWVVTAYSILFGGTLLLGGRLADVLGRRRVFAAGVAVFAVGSLLSGIAWSEAALVGARALQGFGGALLSPAALSIIITTFPEGRERNRALGIWGAAAAAGGSAGVLLGGLLTSYAGWPWIFYVNLPVAVITLAATPFLLSESRGFLTHRHFDIAGAATVTGGLMLLVYGLVYAGEHAWADSRTIALLAASAVLLAVFFVIEWRSKAPLLPLRLFRSRMLSAANAIMVGVGALAFGNFFLVTLYLQEVLGYSAIETGVAFIAITLSIGVFSNIGQALTSRYGPRRVLSTGLGLSAVGILLYAQMPAGGVYFWDVFPPLVVTGIGLGLTFVPVVIAALQGVAPGDAGIASGLINTTRQIGGAIGIAAVTTIAATVTADDTGVARAQALTDGFQASFYVLAAIALVAALAAAAFLGRPRPAEEQLDDVVILDEAA
ncbi:MAG TPA: DHA2 family efflux MFS transporter permease subunit [Gaiellaceae bacterium]|nr:DHA2 family efflux MFS transporter permease subunit [Gaiellaceae bacterium]